ncbi:MAG: ribosomal RNA small subunit methyltransferase A [Phycisphaeraceae bacterium]|nr:ribosomal RNA small subunit methyltransferase A [Phycisphaeraceae bacterium]
MQTATQIKALLAERGLSPRHALGQNFLIDQNLIRRLVDASGVGPGDTVLEIGPGTGALTEALLARSARVVACELDPGLATLLEERLPTLSLPGSFDLVRGDCLAGARTLNPEILSKLGPAAGPGGRFALVANLPYAAGTPLLLALLMDHPACTVMAVTVQREVADRLSARPGSKAYGTLGIVAQAVAEIERIAVLPPECFWPRPDVTSAMVLLRRRPVPLTADAPALARFCQRLFAARRKQLGSTLGRRDDWPLGIRPTQRPEELSVPQFVALCAVAGMKPGSD